MITRKKIIVMVQEKIQITVEVICSTKHQFDEAVIVPSGSFFAVLSVGVVVEFGGLMPALVDSNFQLIKTIIHAIPDMIRVENPEKAMDIPIRRLS